MSTLRIALAQINCTVGDLAGNAGRIAGFAAHARAAGAQLMLTPELALCGYPPEDLLLRPDFYRACARSVLRDLAARLEGIAVVVGHHEEYRGDATTPASLLRDGKVRRHLPQASPAQLRGVRRERYFAGHQPCVVEIERRALRHQHLRRRLGAGRAEAPAAMAGAELLLALNASPYHMNKQATRYEVLRERIAADRPAGAVCQPGRRPGRAGLRRRLLRARRQGRG
jgi:NAD+ synthase (glutamine-hydrolysing)